MAGKKRRNRKNKQKAPEQAPPATKVEEEQP